MRRAAFFFLAAVSFSAASYAATLGWTYGPIANEVSLIAHGGDFPIERYGTPLFVGGPFFKTGLPWEGTFYYADLAFAKHDAVRKNMPDVGMASYFFYLHSDFNRMILADRLFVGGGIEFILNMRVFSGGWSEYDYYPGTDFFLYLDMGYTQSIGPVEVGVKMLYRLLPVSIDASFGTGEIALSAGYRFPKKKPPAAPKEAEEDGEHAGEAAAEPETIELTDMP